MLSNSFLKSDKETNPLKLLVQSVGATRSSETLFEDITKVVDTLYCIGLY